MRGAVLSKKLGIEACSGDFEGGPAAERMAHDCDSLLRDYAKSYRLSRDRIDRATEVGAAGTVNAPNNSKRHQLLVRSDEPIRAPTAPPRNIRVGEPR